MPQMMPINWIISLLFFILIFIMYMMMNYFIFNMKYTPQNKMSFINKKILTWKW